MSEVLKESVGRTRIVTMNRPEARNALTRGVLQGLRRELYAASADPEVRCVVLTGAGGHFCAGADLRRSLMEEPDLMEKLDAYFDEFHGVVHAIVECPKPVVAMLDGAAVGFGANMAFACDLRVASQDAYVQEKFVHIGLMPDGGGTFWLPRLVGTARAMQWILLADKIDAKSMKDLGLVVDVAPTEGLREATLAVTRKLEAGPPLAYAAAKRSVHAAAGDLAAALRREREEQLKLLRSQDCLEGIMAWAQKRTPSFTGK